MSERKEKDPFAEYDKFWDELNEIDEIKDDEDFFKDKRKQKPYSFESYYKETKKDGYYTHNNAAAKWIIGFMAFFFLGIGLITFFTIADFGFGMSLFFPIRVIFFFIFFVTIVSIIIRKAKYK
jgi:hypothetical protein